MKELIRRWLGISAAPVPVEPAMKPGTCECEHARCNHVDGKGKCKVAMDTEKPQAEWSVCACQIFILDGDDEKVVAVTVGVDTSDDIEAAHDRP